MRRRADARDAAQPNERKLYDVGDVGLGGMSFQYLALMRDTDLPSNVCRSTLPANAERRDDRTYSDLRPKVPARDTMKTQGVGSRSLSSSSTIHGVVSQF